MHKEECCGESCGSGCGSDCSCGGNESCCGEETSKSEMFMELANEAWAELMKEKMKAVYEKSMGDKMNKVAAVSVEACMAYWMQKMKSEASCAEFEEKLRKAMM